MPRSDRGGTAIGRGRPGVLTPNPICVLDFHGEPRLRVRTTCGGHDDRRPEHDRFPARDQRPPHPRRRRGPRCAESGSEREALPIALDIDETVYEVKLLHGAMILAARIEKSKGGG